MEIFCAELLGTMLLVLLGDGVVANVLLAKTKGQNSGWIVIAAGWGFGVAVAVYVAGRVSGGHINPAVTIALAAIGKVSAGQVPIYLAGQFLGGFLGAVLVWLAYLPHWSPTVDPTAKLSVFCTVPAIRHPLGNLLCEVIGTAVLLMGALGLLYDEIEPTSGMGPYAVGILVFGIGLSLGGPTGYAINPARDLAPRLAHALLPIPGKGHSDWGYAWIPVVGPIIGGLLGAVLFRGLFDYLPSLTAP
jgi:glycerol uptake facilitator protein